MLALLPIAALLLLQPDIGTLGIIVATGAVLYLTAGGAFRYVGVLVAAGLVVLGLLMIVRPHARDRVLVFLDPGSDIRGSAYQITQAKIAIGSGGFWGRGFGQSIQKFNYLPEPVGDSVFAVLGEEFGFAGSAVLIGGFFLFGYRGFRIGSRAPDRFGRLLTFGIVILILTQVSINIGAMTGLVPLTGVPLTFVSQGGSSLALALAAVGIVLNVSKHT